MRVQASSLVACWLCLSLSATAGQNGVTEPKDHPLRVTTDTLEYCHQLLSRVVRLRDEQTTPSARVAMLTDEGRRMCAHGYVRRGIMRLRRALVMLQDEK